MRLISSLAIVLVLASTGAAAASEADKFKAFVEKKVAPPFRTIGSGKWKALCVCNSTNEVGVLESYGGNPTVGVTCTVPNFDPFGAYTGGVPCYDWTPVTK